MVLPSWRLFTNTETLLLQRVYCDAHGEVPDEFVFQVISSLKVDEEFKTTFMNFFTRVSVILPGRSALIAKWEYYIRNGKHLTFRFSKKHLKTCTDPNCSADLERQTLGGKQENVVFFLRYNLATFIRFTYIWQNAPHERQRLHKEI